MSNPQAGPSTSKPVKRPIVLPRNNSNQQNTNNSNASSSATTAAAPAAHPVERATESPNVSRPSLSPTTSRSHVPSPDTTRDGTPAAAAGPSTRPSVQRPVVVHPSTNTIVINPCQKGNPIINHIRNVAYEWGDIVSDYQVGATTGVLFLSIKYHRLHPEYIHNRISKLGQAYNLRILLVSCDVDDSQEPIKELTKVALINNLTIMMGWSAEELGRYLELYKSFERKGPELIKERTEKDYMSQLNHVLTTVRGVNKTDVLTLTSNFGSLKRMASASMQDFESCPGFGSKKAKRLKMAFEQPFMLQPDQKRKSAAQKRAEAGNQTLN